MQYRDKQEPNSGSGQVNLLTKITSQKIYLYHLSKYDI